MAGILKSVWVAAAAAILATGCVSVKEPLVKFDASGLSGGGSRPDTRVKADDSDEIRDLKQEVARLQRKLADKEEEASREKAKRKMIEDDLERREDEIEDLRKQLRKLQGRLSADRGHGGPAERAAAAQPT